MNPPKSEKKLSELLADLKAEYLIKLPDRITALKALNSARKWSNLEEEFHKLKGNGKTYGFPDISIVCEKLESLCQQKDTQIPGLFDQAIDLLSRMLISYQQGSPLDLSDDTTMKAIMQFNSQAPTHRQNKGNK
jgi:HPt (histidine-containing phosphotransfer) domain-containing protein